MTFDQTKEMWTVHVLNKIPKVPGTSLRISHNSFLLKKSLSQMRRDKVKEDPVFKYI